MISLMTEKMQMLYMDIVASLGKLPADVKKYIFGDEGEEDYDFINSVASNIAMEFIKYSFDYSDQLYSIRQLLEDPDDNNERMLQQRIMNYVMKYKEGEIAVKGEGSLPNNKYSKEMNTIEEKLDGYKITEMNWYEHQNIHDREIIKAIVERRIICSKKISNTRFQEMFKDYDDKIVEVLVDRSKKSDKDMVFSSLAFFTLEWRYSVEMLYRLSCFMEKNGIDTIDRKDLVLLCGYAQIESMFGGVVKTESRMIKERILISQYLLGKESDTTDRDNLRDMIKETLVLVATYKEVKRTKDGRLYKDWFREESSIEDWASFFRYYNVFDIWQKKEWTSKRIRKMRYLFDILTSDSKNPEKCS